MTDLSALDALIVEHIADLEGAQRRIQETVDPRLLREASAVMEKRADALGWVHEFDSEMTIAVAPENWIRRDENGKVNWWFPWFELSSIVADGELDHMSHLSDFLNLQGSTTRTALSFCQENLTNKKWRKLLGEHTKTLQALRDLGFDIDERKGSINLPVRLNPATLKQGFIDDDLEEALAPVGAAMDLAVQALPHFQVLAAAGLTQIED